MDRKLEHKFEQMETVRTVLFDQLRDTDAEVLMRQPTETKWSVLQILHHLNHSERASITYITKKMQGGNAVKKSGITENIRSTVLQAALKLPLKFKVPPSVEKVPSNPQVLSTLEAYTNTRADFRALLNKIPEDMCRRNIYKHPLAGRMNLHQALGFLNEHFMHHEKQIRRLLELS